MLELLYTIGAIAVRQPKIDVPGLGSVLGIQSDLYPSVDRYFAIPYAKSPTGSLRWKKPEPHGPFLTSPLNGTAPGFACMQRLSRESCHDVQILTFLKKI